MTAASCGSLPMRSFLRFIMRYFLPTALLAIGIPMVVYGFQFQFRSRTNVEDDLSLNLMMVGAMLAVTGGCLPWMKTRYALLLGFFSPFVLATLLVFLFWGLIIVVAFWNSAF